MCNYNQVMKDLAQYKAMASELAGTIEELENELKEYMQSEGLETLQGEEHKAIYKAVISNRLDTKALRAELPDIATRYTKTQTTNRFTFH